MSEITYTLLADGSSDVALLAIIDWLIRQHRPGVDLHAQCATRLGGVGLRLAPRIVAALDELPCKLLFVNRDAEKMSLTQRYAEIAKALACVSQRSVALVPIRMTEAWLLSDEAAIRTAAGNHSGKMALNIPPKKKWEMLPNPKKVLFDALICASGKSGRALRGFRPEQKRFAVVAGTVDFSNLRGLTAFDAFEAQLVQQLIGL